MGNFYLAWWKRHRKWRRQRFYQQFLDNQRAWGPTAHIHDLGDPHGKRLLFGGSCEMGQQCSLVPEATLRLLKGPLHASDGVTVRAVRKCVRGHVCEPACHGCAFTSASTQT